ncbi:MAG: hypothetical protein M1832_000505 [Thelocarpon impressellum]|nr:MAG: hypothetical protein M1832_000505 [Thelocarpon impressellum]
MEEEDDDFYEPEPSTTSADVGSRPAASDAEGVVGQPAGIDEKMNEELEEGEEEEAKNEDEEGEDGDESDSDIDIITERKDGSKPEPPSQPPKYSNARNLPARTASSEVAPKPSAPPKTGTPSKGTPAKSGAEYPAVRTSKVDVDAKPEYEPAGKPITEVNIDEDLKEHDKPWRVPGTDVSDYFNYGFDEFTWSLYCLKREKTRAEVEDDKKGFSMVMEGGAMGLPGMPAPPSGPQGAIGMPQLPGMGDMGAEMMAQMAQMMAAGMDPSQMDPAMFGMQQPPNGPGGGGQAQGFGGGQQAYPAQGQNQQQMGYGFDPSTMGGDAGRPRQGNFGGRGRGQNRRNW